MKVGGIYQQQQPSEPSRQGKRVERGTPQQDVFWREMTDTNRHITLDARPGTGKSTSMAEGIYRLLDGRNWLKVRYLAFNKAIADEFTDRVPSSCEVSTFHRWGYQALRVRFGSVEIDNSKSYKLMGRAGVNDWRVKKPVARLVSLAKNHAWDKTASGAEQRLASLLDGNDLVERDFRDRVLEGAARVLDLALTETRAIDFDDMLWIPVVAGLPLPAADVFAIDEAQDLNPVQHQMLERTGEARLIVVGDPYQSIYAFRGAIPGGMAELHRLLANCGETVQLPLTVTFRCPKSHVTLAAKLVPDFTAREGASGGRIDEWSYGDLLKRVEPGSMVLCRLNAPLLDMAIRLWSQGIPVVLKSQGFADALTTVIDQVIGRGGEDLEAFRHEVDDWATEELKALGEDDDDRVRRVQDLHRCLSLLAKFSADLAELRRTVDELFRSRGSAEPHVLLTTIHGAKGLESERVHILRTPARTPKTDVEATQERNLEFVALTRSKFLLSFTNAPIS